MLQPLCAKQTSDVHHTCGAAMCKQGKAEKGHPSASYPGPLATPPAPSST